ncbi:NAD-dependent epimerase [Paraferrimonas haliotis]|uniref:NAD-dependent epimerase n=1 Tax=Paraferrimonas haliotis TaxID=2013866 RepID=UPI000BA9AFFC|nr:NAD-dependent epimerase [Paraferrimonas haliotis]
MNILITGAAGFIGYHLATKLLAQGHEVVGIDNLNDYYEVSLKQARLAQLQAHGNFVFERIDLADDAAMDSLFKRYQFQRVVHLGAQAGVRYSITNPRAYTQSNVNGTLNVLEGCRHQQVEHLVYASSSSVYGLNTQVPFSEEHGVDHPVSLYAATKKSNEMMAHSYSHLYGLATTGLRFFTVYGPWGRPDMAYFSFTKKILAGEPIDVFNEGRLSRDFTYIDDIVEGICATLDCIPTASASDSLSSNLAPDVSSAPYQVFNIGNHQPVQLLSFINTLEDALGEKAMLNMKPMQPGDVYQTYAATDKLAKATGFSPKTELSYGLKQFADWYREYYQV